MDTDAPRTEPRPVSRGAVHAADDDSPSAPSIPSFASLRNTRPRSPADLLVSGPDGAVEPAPPSARPVDTRPVDTRPVDTRPVDTRPVDTRPVDTRPPEWVDLWHLGLRVARWCARQPLTTVRRLLS